MKVVAKLVLLNRVRALKSVSKLLATGIFIYLIESSSIISIGH